MEDVRRKAAMRVQSLIEFGIAEVPPQYIQPPQNRSSIFTAKDESTALSSTCIIYNPDDNDDGEAEIPAIDLFGFDLEHKDSVREAIGDACRDWGAFHVTNHAVPVQLLEEIKSVGLSFFKELPIEDKLKYACDSSSSASEGYGSKMLEANDGVLDWRDYFDHHTLPISRRNPSRWPHSPQNYRRVVADYSDRMNELARKLLGVVSESLGLPSSCIGDAVGRGFYQNITVSYYPPCPQPHLTLGLQSHSDMGAITLLIQQDDVAGLQVLKGSRWVTVRPLSDAIVVLLGDQTEIITNGEYKSAQHRAITNSGRERLSVATFHDPAKTVNISPAAELVSESSPPRYREVNYGEYVSSWYTKGPEGKRNIDALIINV